jgi:hypothetical protein
LAKDAPLLPPPPAALIFSETLNWIGRVVSLATTVMLPLKVAVGMPVRKPLSGSSESPAGKAVAAEKVTGPSAFAVTNRATYSALVVPSGSD